MTDKRPVEVEEKKTRKSGIPTGDAGEYACMAELLRRGFDAQIAGRGTQATICCARGAADRIEGSRSKEATATERKEACQRERNQNGTTCNHCSFLRQEDYTLNPRARTSQRRMP